MVTLGQLSAAQGWQLSPEAQARYIDRALAALGSDAITEGALAATLSYYHSEHPLVEALQSPQHPDHRLAWETLTQHTRRILAAKTSQMLLAEVTLSLEDLTQEALGDIWRGLQRFRYQSRFQTWVFAVIGHCLNRAIRHATTQKRHHHAPVVSLEGLQAEAGEELPDQRVALPEDAAQARALLQLVGQTLSRHPDRRLAAIVQMWALDQYTMREIGDRMQLSVGRIHALLRLAQALLRAEPAIQDWGAPPTE